MQKYRLEIMYFGRDFFGFQSQTDANTIQDSIENALKIILRKDIRICGASRTDSGVHAFKQFATFVCEQRIDLQKFLRSLNGILPRTIGIINISQVSLDFDPIRFAKAKNYRYRLYIGRCHNPFMRDFSWEVSDKIQTQTIEDSVHYFVGEHDFSSFCSIDSFAKSKIRNIYDIKCFRRNNCFEIWFQGAGFLKQMIRIIVGTLVEIGLGKLQASDIPYIFEQKKREYAGKTAPAKGLTLIEVLYSLDKNLEESYNDFYKGECF